MRLLCGLRAYCDKCGERIVDDETCHPGLAGNDNLKVSVLERVLVERHRDLEAELLLGVGVQEEDVLVVRVGLSCAGLKLCRGTMSLR